jgi:hypothetical protein
MGGLTCWSPLISGMSLKRAMTTEKSSMKAVAKTMGRLSSALAPVAVRMWE